MIETVQFADDITESAAGSSAEEDGAQLLDGYNKTKSYRDAHQLVINEIKI